MAIRIIDGIEYEEIYWKDFYAENIANTREFLITSETFLFQKKIFIGDFKFMHFKNTEVYLEDCIFEGDAQFAYVDYQNRITFRRCIFEKRIDFGSATFKSKVAFLAGQCKDHLFISGATFENLIINMECREISITRTKCISISIHGDFYVKLLKQHSINIDFDHIKGFISIKNLDIERISLTGTVDKDAELLLIRVAFIQIEIAYFFNNGRIKFSTLFPIKSPNKFRTIAIIQSNLGKTEFFDFDISQFNDLMITSCYFIECTFVNVTWPKNLNIYAGIAPDEDWLDVKEMYRQLKYAYSKQGDTVNEHKFHALEMAAYEKYLRNERKRAKHLNWVKHFFLHFENRVILYLSRVTSDFGQSFIRPLGTLLVCTTLLFTLLVKTGGIDSLVFKPNFSFHQIIITIGEAMAFANPLRKFEGSHAGWPIIIDLAMRIVSSYCLYNVIRATRRFVK